MAKNGYTQDSIVQIGSPHGWVCDTCGKELTLPEEEIEKLERPRPHTKPEDWDYYIPCPFCKTGNVQQPTLSLTEALQSISGCDE